MNKVRIAWRRPCDMHSYVWVFLLINLDLDPIDTGRDLLMTLHISGVQLILHYLLYRLHGQYHQVTIS